MVILVSIHVMISNMVDSFQSNITSVCWWYLRSVTGVSSGVCDSSNMIMVDLWLWSLLLAVSLEYDYVLGSTELRWILDTFWI